MSKFLKITSLDNITPAGMDGHKFRLSYEIGELVGTEFVPSNQGSVDLSLTGSLQKAWGLSASEIAPATGSYGTTRLLQQAGQGNEGPFDAIRLNTFNAPPTPPQMFKITGGALFAIPERPAEIPTTAEPLRITSLSTNISEIRDQVNAIMQYLSSEKLLDLPQERGLLDIYQNADTVELFGRRIQSLGALIVAVNKKAIAKELGDAKIQAICTSVGVESLKQVGSITVLEELLTAYSDERTARSICDVFKAINALRQGYPTHGDNVDSVIKAHDFFNLGYPIEDYPSAWDGILGRYFDAMKDLLKVVKTHREKVASGA
jgi:hypothetical protein